MSTVQLIERSEAEAMVTAVLGIASADGGAKVTIGVSGIDGILVALQRMDGAQPLGVNVVIAKLHTAIIGKKDTIARTGKGVDPADFNDGLFTTLGGGVVLRRDGEVVGALAVSGRTPEDDHALADRVRTQFGFA